MSKKILINIIKFCIAAGLIYWLMSSGKLDFKLLQNFISSPLLILIVFLIYIFDQIVNTMRYQLILASKIEPRPSLWHIFILNWIGLFFSSVLPGSVTGDFVKIFYVKNLDKNISKKFLIFSVLLDRVVGLTGLIIVGGLCSLIFYNKLATLSTQIAYLMHINIFLMSASIISLAMLFLTPKLGSHILRLLGKITTFKSLSEKLGDLWCNLVDFRKKLVKLVFFGMFAQTVNAFIFWFTAKSYAEGSTLEFSTVLSVFPIGQISLAIPIAPAGMGVGHAIFDKLLGFFQITNGASLFNLYFFIMLSFNILGIICYIFYSGKTHQKIHLQDLEESL